MEEIRSFAFIGEIIDAQNETEFEILPGHILKKANETQIGMIKNTIQSLGSPYYFLDQYESIITERTDSGVSTEFTDDKAKWNYWIIECQHTSMQEPNEHLQLAIKLCQTDLNVLFTQIVRNGEYFGNKRMTQAYFNFLEGASWMAKKAFSTKDAIEVSEIADLLQKYEPLKERYKYVTKSLEDFRMLSLIPSRSSYRYLAVFAIIEALLVSEQKQGGSGASITSQLCSKISLMNNRFKEPIDINNYFSNAKFKTIISKLYDYRGSIAHGDFSDFKDGLQVIRDRDYAYDFLLLLVKKLLLQALIEPQLFGDLKYC